MARNEWIIIRATREEKQKIVALAHELGIDVSEMIRGVYLQRLNISEPLSRRGKRTRNIIRT